MTRRDDIEEYISASAVTDIYYVAYRMIRDRDVVRLLITNLLKIVSVVCVSEREIKKALELEWKDFETSKEARDFVDIQKISGFLSCRHHKKTVTCRRRFKPLKLFF